MAENEVPFDEALFDTPATQGDVAGAQINIALLSASLRSALRKIADEAQVDVTSEIETIEKVMKTSYDLFKELSGYNSDAS